MTDRPPEHVLVVPADAFRRLGVFHGLCTNVDKYLPDLLAPELLQFLPRDRAEHDPGYKQIIPYVVFRHGDSVFRYRRGRQGAEKRLTALQSIGVGGHISREDAAGSADPYRTGMLREIAEEVDLESGYTERCVGLINDDSTPVGRVHLGIAHVFELELPKLRTREDGLADAGFAPLVRLRGQAGQFETWSQFLLAEGVL